MARRLDKRLGGLARKLGLAYTRYADDLTLSGDEALHSRVGYVMARVRHIAEAEGFAVNGKNKEVMMSDKTRNSIFTFSFPEAWETFAPLTAAPYVAPSGRGGSGPARSRRVAGRALRPIAAAPGL